MDGDLTLDRDVLDIREGRWVMRFPYAAGGYTVAWTLVDLGDGAVSVSTGCFGSADGGGTYQAAGCRLDRL